MTDGLRLLARHGFYQMRVDNFIAYVWWIYNSCLCKVTLCFSVGQHQARCSRTRGCAYFTAFPIQPNLFWCHLQDCERWNGMLRTLTKCPGCAVEPNVLRQDDQQPGLVRINHWCYMVFFSCPVYSDSFQNSYLIIHYHSPTEKKTMKFPSIPWT